MAVTPLEERTIRKISARLLPLLIACYFAAFLDRVNVSFAALTMNADLGLSATQYGLGAGAFFITYFLFEVPSNLLLARFGARKWIARIMFGWGVASAATAFVETATGFYIVRLLLGAAEAGFFPGIIFYLTLWFPAIYRARIIGYFMAAGPLSTVIGAPLSGLLLRMDGVMGLHGWQWLFIVEALPSLILSAVAFVYLTDRPAEADWLSAGEREWLDARLAREERERLSKHDYTVGEALTNRRLLALSAVYFGIIAANVGLGFFLPQIVQAFGMSTFQTTLVSAVPYLAGTIGIVLWGRRSDRKHERRFHTAFPLLVAGCAIAGSAFVDDATAKMAALSAAAFGIFASMPVFWTLPTFLLSGAAAAGGIAMINSIGNLAGFVGPYVMGWARDATGTYVAGLISLAVACLASMTIVLTLRDDESLEASRSAAGTALQA
jgi:MFS transporter, ACS family, tartrate transporter